MRLVDYKPKKPSKYGNKIVTCDGYRFMSIKERNHYLTLKRMLNNHQITDLMLQPAYPITVNGYRICKVILDFKYKTLPDRKEVIVDVKGHDTAMSKLKRKLVESQYGFKVVLV